METFFISTPIYYVNASPHLGHAYTTILADCFNRFNKLLQKKTFFLTGTDEHGDKIAQAAEENKQDPKSYVDKVSGQFRELWPYLGIENDYFIRTTEPGHKECVKKFLQLVYDQGDIYFGEYGGYYCFGCERFYTEKELVDGLCPDHFKKPEYIHEKNYFFAMSKYQGWLIDYIKANPEFIQPAQYKNEVLGMLRDPLDDLCISRPKSRLNWGIELPFDQDYVTYVWFDALLNYISALGWPDGRDFKEFWPNAHHIVAKDIIKPHAIFWPMMLKSAGVDLYKGLRVHGYWKVDQNKMSKSLGNVVNPLQMREKYGLDAFRYFLLREMHFGQDGSFSEKALLNRFNSDLANDLGNLFNRTLSMTHKYFKGMSPNSVEFLEQDLEMKEKALNCLNGYIEHFTNFQTAQALEELWELVRALNRYIDLSAPWVMYKNNEEQRLKTVMAIVLAGLRKIAIALWPVMPESSSKMAEQLGFEINPSRLNLLQEKDNWEELLPNTKVAKRSNIFPRKEMVQTPEDEKESKRSGEKKKNNKEDGQIEFSEFQRLDLRIGKVLEADYVQNADKLLKLKVELGEGEPRQIVAGLAKDYSPEGIAGKQVVVVSNLKPRKLRGITSQGMVLAVHAQAGLNLILPEKEVEAGSKVS